MSEPKYVGPYGPLDAKIVIVGEAPGETEERYGVPFCGTSGEELGRMLSEAGLDKSKCRLTNVFKYRPPDNKLEKWCVTKKELPSDYSLQPIFTAKYLAPQYCGAVSELHEELKSYRPNLLIVAGGVATWALGLGSISQSRGVVTSTKWGKALPIYHPAAVLRQWSWRPIVVADLLKARYESEFPEVRRPRRELWIEPTLLEVIEFFQKYVDPASEVSVDIENPGGPLACIGIAPSPERAICIPFVDPRKPDRSYWNYADERIVWRLLRNLLVHRNRTGTVKIIGQNFLYDAQHLHKATLNIASIDDDTMLMHHAMFPEMKKGLGFLGSIYTNELSWKQMHKDLGRDK